MFENYPQYRHEIHDALEANPPKQRLVRATVTGIAFLIIALISAILIASAIQSDHRATLVRSVAAEALSNSEQPIEVTVTEDSAVASLLGTNSSVDSTDTQAVQEMVRADIAQSDIDAAKITQVDESTSKMTLQTTEGIAVEVIVKTDNAGKAEVSKITATVSSSVAPKKQETPLNLEQVEAEKAKFADPIGTFTEESLLSTIGYEDPNSTDNQNAAANKNDSKNANANVNQPAEKPKDKKDYVADHIAALNRAIIMALPKGYSEENGDASSESSAAETSTSMGVAIATTPQDQQTDPKQPTLKEQTRAWSSADGSIITVRTEKIDPVLAGLSGKEIVDKMIQYWQETSSAVAQGAGQKISDTGYKTKVCYDAATNTWGYRGSVEFSDDSRTISYKRAVFVDAAENAIISVSYRHDQPTSAEKPSSALSAEDFWKLFGVMPVMPEYMGPIVEEKLAEAYIPAGTSPNNASAQGGDGASKSSDASSSGASSAS